MEENQATKDKRVAIREIMTDSTLNAQEKQLRIQALMSFGHLQVQQMESSSSKQNSNAEGSGKRKAEGIVCIHYERECEVVAPCCNQVYACRLCHDDVEDHTLPRFEIQEVICKKCGERQSSSNKCQKEGCGIEFASYYCGICNLWIGGSGAESKKPFHCDKCGICRVGGRENFSHCEECCMCIRNGITDHQCIKDKYKNMCPVCREDMFSSRQSPIELACGHCIHDKCFRTLAQFDYRCPICKKTACDEVLMEEEWASRARDIQMQPMPANLSRVVSIICNDCAQKASGLSWHFLGVQCPSCRSFNTSISSSDQDTTRNHNNANPIPASGDTGLSISANSEGEQLSSNESIDQQNNESINSTGDQNDHSSEVDRQDIMDTRS